jgi:hypothetical protein
VQHIFHLYDISLSFINMASYWYLDNPLDILLYIASFIFQVFHRAIYTMRELTEIRHVLAEERTIHDTWYTLYFFRNKTFLFVKRESWNFQQLFDLGFRETLQNFSSFRQTFRWHFCGGIRVVWMSWNFLSFTI